MPKKFTKPKPARAEQQAAWQRGKVAGRRAAGQCIQCGRKSKTLRCKICRPKKKQTVKELATVRRAAALMRWGKI